MKSNTVLGDLIPREPYSDHNLFLFFIFITRRGVDAPIQARLLHIIARNLARFPSPSRLLLPTLQTVWTDTSCFTLKTNLLKSFTLICLQPVVSAHLIPLVNWICPVDGRAVKEVRTRTLPSMLLHPARLHHLTGGPPVLWWKTAMVAKYWRLYLSFFFFLNDETFIHIVFFKCISVTDNNFRPSQHHPPGFTRSALYGWRNPAEYFVHGRRRFLWPWNGSISHVTKVMKVS